MSIGIFSHTLGRSEAERESVLVCGLWGPQVEVLRYSPRLQRTYFDRASILLRDMQPCLGQRERYPVGDTQSSGAEHGDLKDLISELASLTPGDLLVLQLNLAPLAVPLNCRHSLK